MKKWKKDVEKEMDALQSKLNKLSDWMFYNDEYEELSMKKKALIHIQLDVMTTYYSVLEARYDNG